MSDTADRGSGLLPPDPDSVVLGFNIPFAMKQYYLIPFFQPPPSFSFHFLCIPLSPGGVFWAATVMVIAGKMTIDDSVEAVENFSLDDFSIQITPDTAAAKNTLETSIVGRFFSKREYSTATMRKVLSGMWRLQRGWRFQLVDRKSKTFVFRLNSVGEVKHILSHGPWSPCDGFMLVAAMPEDGLWSSADLSSVELWVKAHGVPLELLTDEAAVQMANRVGKFVAADRVRRNGILVNSFLRFRTRINISLPLVPGVSLEGNGKKKHWAFFKFEQLPVFCFKCSVIGHMEDVCSGRKRVVLVDDGRSVPLFGPWLRDGSRLENGFALLEVEEIQDRIVLEKHDVAQDSAPVSGPHLEATGVRGVVEGDPESSSKKIGGDAPGLVRNDLLSGGMEGVPRQRSDTAFTVAYNDYVELPFPSQHVAQVAKIFQENLGPVRFGASLKDDDITLKRNKSTYQLKKSKMVGPNGIPKTPVFRFSNRDLESKSGGKRKKTCRDDFTGESTGNDCIAVVENHRVKDVFGAGSAILPGDVESGDGESTFSNKKLCRAEDNLATEILQCSTQSEGIGGASGDLVVESAPARIDGFSVGRGGGPYHAPQIPMKLLSWNCRGLGQARAVEALRGLVLNKNPDVLFLMETKVKSVRMSNIWRRLGFFNAIVVEAEGSSGGLCLCWKFGIDVVNLGADKSAITVRFANILNKPAWNGIFVYGPPVRGDRVDFWESLSLQVSSMSEPWVLLGDLNSLLNQSEKFGGSLVSSGESHSLSDFLMLSGGVDIGCIGNFFTWSNKRSLPYLIKERLDRVIGAPEWVINFPKAGVKALSIRASDHAPLVLDLLFNQENVHRPFRFLDAWTRDPSCFDVVRNAWNLAVRGVKSFQLVSRIANTRKMLAKWNREYFGFCKEKLSALEKLLLDVQNRVPSLENSQLEVDILLEIDEVSARQCMIHGFKVCPQSPPVSHLMYADDTFLFCKARVEEVMNRFLALTNWDSICKPKEHGGLGIKRFADLNLALISKLGWIIANGDERLWCRIFRAKYCKRGDTFWNMDYPCVASKAARGILMSRELIRNESCWLVANGKSIDLWSSPWIPWLNWNEYIAAFNPRIHWPKVCWLHDFFCEETGRFRDELAEWFIPHLGQHLGRLKILHHADQDRLIWRDATDGSFSVKQTYLSLIKPRLGLVNPLWSKIWKAPLQERVKFFLWKVGMNILPCGTRIQAIFGTTRRCVLCNDAEDSLLHLFFHCPFARACVVPIRLDAVRFTQFAALLCYSLWETRNRAFHDGSLPRPMDVLAKTVKLVEEFRQALVINSESVLENFGECRAIPHEPRDFNFYVDAAVRGNEAYLAVVVFDRTGGFVDALSAKAAVNSALEAECLALCHAFSLCSSWGCVEANFFSDCLQLVTALNKNTIPVWHLSHLFLHLFNSLSFAAHGCVFWLPRSANLVAHKVAAWAASHNVCRPLLERGVAPFVAT
uniref:Reverse transcriptase n=1 Tax=Cannabis sativa TaxID=3483 RepID=A0A803NWY4_CANSA